MFILAAIMLLTGCTKDITIKLSESNKHFEAEGGNAEITLESNGSWQVSGCPEWLSVTPMSGEGNATLALTCEGNISGQERSAEIKLTTKKNNASFTVTQAFVEGEFLVFTPESINSDFQGGDFSIRIDANCDWSINALPDWIRCEPMSGSQSANIVVTIDPYTTSSESNREYNIDFTAGEKHFYLPVQQEDDQAYHIVPTPRTLDVGAEGATHTIALQGITPWTLHCPADWVTVTPTSGDGDGEITVTIAPNRSYNPRNTRIILTSSVGCGSSVSISQEAAINPHYLEVNPSELTFPSEESTLELSISTDSIWHIISSDSWITFSQQSGNCDATISVTAAQNTHFGNRHAAMEIVSGSIARRVTIIQESGTAEPILNFSTNLLQVDYEHTICPVSITSNAEWTLRMSEDWVLSTITEGVGDANINLVAKENMAQEPRTAMVFLCYHNVPYDTLVVEQAAHLYQIEASVTELNASQQGDTFVVTVTANQGWEVLTNSSWIHLNPDNGWGDGIFRIVVDANNTPAARTAEVKLNGKTSGMIIINVHQPS